MSLNISRSANSGPDGKGFSARQLALLFLTGVAVCAVFFSLGFLLGYNERSTRGAPVTEGVSNPGTIPPTVNAPIETTQIGNGGAAASTNSIPPPVKRAENSPPAAQPEAREPQATTASNSPPATPAVPAAPEEEKFGSGEGATPSGAPRGTHEGFIIQVVAASARQDADTLVRVLKNRGFRVFLVTPENAHANDRLYRVQVGPFASRAEAEKARAKLTQEGFKPFIRH